MSFVHPISFKPWQSSLLHNVARATLYRYSAGKSGPSCPEISHSAGTTALSTLHCIAGGASSVPACSAAGTATAVADVGAGAPGDSSGVPRDSGMDPAAPAVPAAAPLALQRISPARQAAATAAVRRFADKLAGRDADLAAPAERSGEPATGHDMGPFILSTACDGCPAKSRTLI